MTCAEVMTPSPTWCQLGHTVVDAAELMQREDVGLVPVVAENSNKLVGFASKSSPTDSRIVGGHQYTVVAYNNTTKTVTLFNPWGLNNGSAHPGLVDLHLSQLAGSFDYWSVG